MPKRGKARSQAVIDFIQELRIPEGAKVGQKFKLEPFQKKFIHAIYGGKVPATEAFLSIARKNGKTGLLAAILLAHVVGPEARLNSQVVSGARSRDQAALLWSLAAKIVDLTPEITEHCHIIPSSKKILGLLMNVEYKALSADGAKNMGISPVLAILDEVGQVVGPSDYFTDAITSSQGAHDDPLLIAISTQAPSDADLWSIWLDDAIRTNDPSVVCHIYAADEDCDLMDKKQWRKANPALGKFLNMATLEKEMKKATRLPSEQAKAQNLYLNQRIAQESLWLAPAIWKENCGEPDWEVFRDKGVHLALDLSMRNDLTAAAICAEDDDGVVHGACFAFSPLGGIAERSQRDRVPYDAWARDGVIYAPPGDTLNYDMIADWLRIKLQEEEIPINSLGFDRWRITDMQQAAERVGFAQDCEWVEVGQGFQSMSPIVEHFESLLLERRLKLGNNPILNLGASSAIAVSDPSGGRKLSKTKASNKIDGIVALIMAVHRTAQNNEMFDAAAMIG